MNAAEVAHYASQLAALTVTAARAQTAKELSEIHAALEETYLDALTLLAHDTEETTSSMERALLSRIESLSRVGASA